MRAPRCVSGSRRRRRSIKPPAGRCLASRSSSSPTRATPYTAGGEIYCMGSSSFDDYSSPAREMCMEIGGGGGRGRRGGSGGRTDGGKTTKQKQPQRGLGVAQLEKIRLHNQMLAAYRSATAAQQLHDDAASTTAMTMHQLVPPPPPAAVAPGGGSSFQPYHHLTNRCFEETDHHHRGVVHYYDDGLLPYSSTPTSPPAPTTPSLYAHDVRDDSSGHRLGQPPQQHYWMVGSRSGDGASAEELDLELRL